ncbi:MAG: hypothetical protein ABR988_03190 [Terriglobales bacterium]|jgi:hypothetical protein
MKKPGFVLLIVVGLAIVWHIILYLPMDRERCVDEVSSGTCKLRLTLRVNPLTDVAVITAPPAAAFGITDPAVAAGFQWGFALTGTPTAESQLNLYARQYLDLYAMLLPYRVSIINQNLAADNPVVAQSSRDDWKQLETHSDFDLGAHLTHSLADATLTSGERVEIYKVIDDFSFKDRHQREKPETVMSARVGSIGLAKDGSQQVLVQWPESTGFCGASGNCPIWIFIRHGGQLQLALETGGQDIILRSTFSRGFRDLAMSSHWSASEKYFSVYRWNGTKYGPADCYIANFDSNPPVITDCEK